MKQFISAHDAGNINELVSKAVYYRNHPRADIQLGAGKRIGLIFLNPSMRTRLSTQIAAQNLGMEAIVFNADKDGWKMEFEEEAIMSGHTVEHVKDAAPILGRYFDILAIRTFPGLVNRDEDYSEHVMNQFIRYAGIPVLSLESATVHPLQSLTDIITIKDHFTEQRKPRVVLSWAPHIKPLPQCVANSFAQWINAWGEAELVITHPPDYELDPAFTQNAYVTHNQQEALHNADFVYVKNWSTFTDYGRIYSNDPSWMLTPQSLAVTRNAKVMHCLPVRRNVELSDEVLDSSASLVTQQAANRVWAAQAVLAEMLKNNE
ncbi:MAG: N-acetylornithine carbamoyltransferase [Dinghuibacter sp.]|nr:N-acetylornithine carbamoyltransferase [Dinghuibacter sp.]